MCALGCPVQKPLPSGKTEAKVEALLSQLSVLALPSDLFRQSVLLVIVGVVLSLNEVFNSPH